MNMLLENKVISELKYGSNFAYVLNDNNDFLLTEYKVLQSKINDSFVNNIKMLYNGKIQLLYLLDEYKVFSNMVTSLNPDIFIQIITNLISTITEVKNNGFLSCENIDISFDKIYIDTKTLKVKLVYLPIREKFFEEYDIFQNEFRTSFIKLINDNPSLLNSRINKLASDLSDGTLSLEDIYNKLITGSTNSPFENGTMCIVSINAPKEIKLQINKKEFLIGKNPAIVDGPIMFNKAISRIHCKITKNNNNYMITDMNSANGTFLNRLRLPVNKPIAIKNGDIIRLANSDFKVIIG